MKQMSLQRSALPEDDEMDGEIHELQEKIAELEKEVGELRVSKIEVMKQMQLERKEHQEEFDKLEREFIELQDECDSLNERIVQMKIEYRAATKDDHDETSSLIRDRGAVKVGKNNNNGKKATQCVMFGFGIW